MHAITPASYGAMAHPPPSHLSSPTSTPADHSSRNAPLEECTYEYDDTEVSVPFTSVAFSSSLALGRDLSQFWVLDSARSINLTAFRSDFVMFAPPSAPSRVGGVGVDVKDSGTIRLFSMLSLGQAIHRTIHALYILDLSSRFALRMGRPLSVSWMQSHSGCEFIFPNDYDTGMLMVPT
jgi:hypothetical protein